jgi:thiol-disulfide isomerase/thioredoxin
MWGRREVLVGLGGVVLGACRRDRSPVLPIDPVSGTVALADGPTFSALTSGRVTVIDFWATWCEPCRTSIPKVIDFAGRQPADVVVVGVHVGEGYENALRFAAEAGIGYPLYADPDYSLSGKLGASRVPTIVVLDRGGAVAHRDDEITAAVAAAVTTALG